MSKISEKISPGEGNDRDALYDRLSEACEGLVYVSETDADIIPFVGGLVDRVDMRSILHLSEAAKDSLIQEADPDEFFARLTADREWFGERERARAAGYARLEKALKEYLKGLKVFRVGHVRIEIFIGGIDRLGRIAGVRTWAVET